MRVARAQDAAAPVIFCPLVRVLAAAEQKEAMQQDPVVPPDSLRGGSDTPAVPAPPHGLARPEAIYYQGEWLPQVMAGWGAGSAEGDHPSQTAELRP